MLDNLALIFGLDPYVVELFAGFGVIIGVSATVGFIGWKLGWLED